jgi:hypothetical protein
MQLCEQIVGVHELSPVRLRYRFDEHSFLGGRNAERLAILSTVTVSPSAKACPSTTIIPWLTVPVAIFTAAFYSSCPRGARSSGYVSPTPPRLADARQHRGHDRMDMTVHGANRETAHSPCELDQQQGNSLKRLHPRSAPDAWRAPQPETIADVGRESLPMFHPPNARFSRRGATTGHERRGAPVAATNEVSAGANGNRRDAARARWPEAASPPSQHTAPRRLQARVIRLLRGRGDFPGFCKFAGPTEHDDASSGASQRAEETRRESRHTSDFRPAVSDAGPRAYCATSSRTTPALAPTKRKQRPSRERACAKRRIRFR